jgi:hypothetical protein
MNCKMCFHPIEEHILIDNEKVCTHEIDKNTICGCLLKRRS